MCVPSEAAKSQNRERATLDPFVIERLLLFFIQPKIFTIATCYERLLVGLNAAAPSFSRQHSSEQATKAMTGQDRPRCLLLFLFDKTGYVGAGKTVGVTTGQAIAFHALECVL